MEHNLGSYGSDSTIVGVLRRRATEQADRLAYRFLADGEVDERDMSYGALDLRARSIAAHLQQRGLTGGQALLLYPPGLDYIAAFCGCLYAGVVAVPAYPPRQNRSEARVRAIANDARPQAVLSTRTLLSGIRDHFERDSYVMPKHWIATDGDITDLSDSWRRPDIEDDTLAFLQYTSGSTANPKGVMVTHGNLMSNEAMIQKSCGHSETSTFV